LAAIGNYQFCALDNGVVADCKAALAGVKLNHRAAITLYRFAVGKRFFWLGRCKQNAGRNNR
jgi:hypothetical protein